MSVAMVRSESGNIVGTVDLRQSVSLVFSIQVWQGRSVAHVRKFVSSPKYKGPTKSGLTFAGDLLVEVVEALRRLQWEIPDMQEREFTRVSKSPSKKIVIGFVPSDADNALPGVDVREYVDTASFTGFTKKGIRFPWDKLSEVIALMEIQAKQLGEPKGVEKPTETDISGPAEYDAIVKEMLPDGPKGFPEEFVGGQQKGNNSQVDLPDEPIELVQQRDGKYVIRSSRGFCHAVRNPTEASFILYTHLQGHRTVQVPGVMIDIFRAVKAYENYLREIRDTLMQAYEHKCGNRAVAEHKAKEAFRTLGLPWIERS